MAAAVLIDATIVRGVLLPAGLALLGERVWPQKRRGARGLPGAQPAGVTSTPVTDGVTVR
jgi:RND superfamily putative drug exporter